MAAWRDLVRMHGTPHGIALGVALGVGLSLVPVPVAGMLLAPALAPLLRASPVAAYLGTTVVNPVTGPIIYFGELWLGTLVTGAELPSWQAMRSFSSTMWWDLFKSALWPFCVGALLLIPVGALGAYGVSYGAVRLWQRRLRIRNGEA